MSIDGGDTEEVIAKFKAAGINDGQLAADLQREGAESFVKSWQDLLDCVASKSVALQAAFSLCLIWREFRRRLPALESTIAPVAA